MQTITCLSNRFYTTETTLLFNLKPGFHYPSYGPSSRPVNSGAFFDTRELGPSTRVLKNFLSCTGRVHGRPGFHYRSWRPELTGVKNASELTGHQLGPWTRPWTRVMETDLYSSIFLL